MVLLTLPAAEAGAYSGASFITGTIAPDVVPFGYDDNFVLRDGISSTYFSFLVFTVQDFSQGTTFGPLSPLNGGLNIPNNCMVRSVTLNFRLGFPHAGEIDEDGGNCGALTSTVDIYGVYDPVQQQFLSTLTITRSFADYQIVPLGRPFTVGTLVPWLDEGINGPFTLDNCRFGVRVHAPCSQGNPSIFPVLTRWSEATLTVDVKPPIPTVTTLAVGSVGVGAADLRGSFNPNQDIFFAGAGATYQFQFGADPNALVAVGNVQGPVYGNAATNVSFTQHGLTGLTSYYYRLTVTVDGDLYLGNTVTFKTTSTDPSFGAY